MKKLLRVAVAVAVTACIGPVAGALGAVTPAASTAPASGRAGVDPHLRSLLATSAPTDKLTVFVRAADVTTAKRAVATSHLRLLDTFDKVGAAVAQGTPRAIRSVLGAPGVTYVEADRPIIFFTATSHQATREDEARATIKDAGNNAYEGAGISIAVVDSGIDGTHPMFQENGVSKVVRNLKLACAGLADIAGPTPCRGPVGDANDQLFVDMTALNDTDTPSGGGHGTHVASIAAGVDVTTGGGLHLHGAAPKAKLVGLSVGQTLSVYGGDAGLNWVLEHHDAPCVDSNGTPYSNVSCPPIRVVNNSYGPTGGGTFDPSSVTVAIQRALVADGVAVTWAAGNGDATNNGGDGSDVRTNPPGQDPTNGILMVANYDDAGHGSADNAVDSSSSRGKADQLATYPDLSAPGTNITSACRPYLVVCNSVETDDLNYGTISGTSMAAPYVAGVVATLMSANPALSPADIELALEDTAHHFTSGAPYVTDDPARNPNTASKTSFDKGHGLVDVVAALNKVLGNPVVLPPPGAATCTPDGPVAVDPAGDAKDFAVRGTLTNEPALDIRRVDVSANAAHDTTFTVTVDNLGATNPQTAPSIAFDTYFTYDAQDFWAEASRANDGTLAFKLGQAVKAETVSTRIPLADVTGGIDVATNRIWVTVPAAALTDASGKAPADGDALTAMSTVARRAVVTEPNSQGQSADDVDATCPYTYGLGAVPPPVVDPPPPAPFTPPAPAPGADVAVGSDYTWSAPPSASDKFDGIDGDCERDETGPACDRRGINVTVPPGGGILTVNATAQDLVDDIDLAVYKPNGDLLGQSADLTGIEQVQMHVDASGVYTVIVTSFAHDLSGYDGSASIAADVPAPPAAPAGTVSAGSPYTWDGAVPVPTNPIFSCVAGTGDLVCDVRTVQVNVPSGSGHTLTVATTPQSAGEQFRVYIYGPDGKAMTANGTTSGAGSGLGTFTVPVSASGVYRVGITSLLATGGAYHAVASIA